MQRSKWRLQTTPWNDCRQHHGMTAYQNHFAQIFSHSFCNVTDANFHPEFRGISHKRAPQAKDQSILCFVEGSDVSLVSQICLTEQFSQFCLLRNVFDIQHHRNYKMPSEVSIVQYICNIQIVWIVLNVSFV